MAKTKEKILDTALELFNKQGSRTVTTNHIADACGISTGTLYYHFKNKEEIILALYNQMGMEWETPLEKTIKFDRAVFEEFKKFSDMIYKKYRFIGNELYSLCQNDLQLDMVNRERLKIRKMQMHQLLTNLIETEGYEKLDEVSMEFLVDAIWMFAVFWHPYRDMLYPNEEGSPIESLDLLLEKFLVIKDKKN